MNSTKETKIKLFFSNKNNKNNKKSKNSFKLLNEKELQGGFLKFLKELIIPQQKLNNTNKLIYIKGSSTKEYYKKINKN